jgi:hypothetical protein
MAGSSGLSDVLRDMVEGKPQNAGTPARPAAQQTAASTPDDADHHDADDDEVLVAEVDEPERPSFAAAPAASSARRRAPASQPDNHTLKEVGACLFTTFSLLMLLWAVWGTLILLGFEIWRHDQPDAANMAKISQVFYLLAAVGLAYSGFLFYQISRDKKKQKQAAAKRGNR